MTISDEQFGADRAGAGRTRTLNLADKIAADKSQDALLSHHLNLVVGLVGPEVALELELGDLFRARPNPAKWTGLQLSDSATGAARDGQALDETDKRGMGFLRIDESKLPLHMFDDAEAEGLDLHNPRVVCCRSEYC